MWYRSSFLAFVLAACVVAAGDATAQAYDPGDPPNGAVALTPVIGVDPTSLDFGCVEVGTCLQLGVDLFNDVNDPTSILEISSLLLVPPGVAGGIFSLLGPAPPLFIPGDGTRVEAVIEFCPPDPGVFDGISLEIVSPNALDPQTVLVPLSGIGNALPICDAGGAYSGNVGDTITFDGSGSNDPGGAIVSWEWAFGDGTTGSGETTTHVYGSPGTFTVTLTVTDDCDASSSCMTTAEIAGPGNELPICDAGGPYSGDVGDTINFDGSGSNDPDGTIVSWDWEFGDGTTGMGETTTHVYASGGLYVVTLTVTDNDQGSTSCTSDADINEPPVCDPAGPYGGAVGESILFDASGSSDPDGAIVSYAWDFGDGTTGSGEMPTHSYSMMGMYTVGLCVTDDDGAESCCETFATITQPTPVTLASLQATSHDGEVVMTWQTTHESNNLGFNVLRATLDGTEVQVNDRRIEPRADRAYRFSDRSAVPGETYDYAVEAVGTDGSTEVHGPVRVTVAQVLPKQVLLRPVHPNPFNPSTTVSFELPEAGRVTVTIYNAAGRPVRTLVDGFREADVHAVAWDGLTNDGQPLPSGVYFVELRTGAVTTTRKMVMAR